MGVHTECRGQLPRQSLAMARRRWFEFCILLCCLWSRQAVADRYTLDRYVDNVGTIVNYHAHDRERYATLNAFIDRKVKHEWSNVILGSYARKMPIVLFESDSCNSKLRADNIKFHRLIAIYEHLNDVNILDWKSRAPDHWNPRAEFIIWITGGMFYEVTNRGNGKGILFDRQITHTTHITIKSARKIFEDFWDFDIINVVIVYFNSSIGAFSVLNYNPFLSEDNGRRGKVFRVNQYNLMFPDKFTNLQAEPLQISMFEKVPYVNLTDNNFETANGEDVDMIKILQAKMNFSVQLITHHCPAASYGTTLPDGSHAGLIADLLINRSDILGNTRYIDVVFDRQLEALYPIDSGAYYALVPMSPEVSILHRISHHWLSPKYLLCLSPMLLLTVYLHLRKEPNPILITWNLVLNQRFLKIGQRSYDRVLRFTFIVFAMLITFGFEGRLYETLTSHSFKHEINTMKDLDESGLTLMVGDKMFDPINKSTIPVMQRISLKTRTNLNFSQCTDTLVKLGNVACAIDEMSALIALDRLWKVQGKYKPHLMEDELGIFWMSFIVRQDLPYLTKFNAILRRVLESGLKAKGTRHSREYVKTIFKKDSFRRTAVINLRHLQSIFYTCLGGIGISFVVFLVELYLGKREDSM